MNYLLDTNVFVIYGRESQVANRIEKQLQLFDNNHNLAVSTVSLGELDALEKQLHYGQKRKDKIKLLLNDVFKINISNSKIIKRYGDIDAFSQGRLKGKPLHSSARNMGKNDLWIAATASVFEMTLITTDKDFKHLDKIFLNVQYVNLEDYK